MTVCVVCTTSIIFDLTSIFTVAYYNNLCCCCCSKCRARRRVLASACKLLWCRSCYNVGRRALWVALGSLAYSSLHHHIARIARRPVASAVSYYTTWVDRAGRRYHIWFGRASSQSQPRQSAVASAAARLVRLASDR